MSPTTTRKRIILVTVFLLVSIFILTALYILIIRPRPSKGNSELMKAIPTDAALILLCTQPVTLITEISETSYWNDLMEINRISCITSTLREFDSALQSHPRLMEFLNEYPSALTLQLDKTSSAGVLYLLELPSMFHRKTIRNFLNDFKGEDQTTSGKYRGKVIYRIHTSRDSGDISFTFINGLFLAGTDSVILYKAIDHIMSGENTIWEDPSFKRAYNTTGKMVYAHVFINNKMLDRFFPLFLDKDVNNTISTFSLPSGWSAFDLIIKQQEMILNGFTAIKDTSSPFYQICQKMSPQPMMIHHILPYNTVFSIQKGIDRFDDFIRKLKGTKRIDDTLFNRQIRSAGEPSRLIDLEKRMESIAGPEICLAFTGLYGSSLSHDAYLIIRTSQVENSLISLNILSDPLSKTTIMADGVTIRKLIIPNPFKIVFEPLANDNPFEWYTNLDEYIIFGESSASIHKFISYYNSGRTLGKSTLYSEYLDNFPERSNLMLNMNIRNAGEAVLSLLNDSLATEIRRKKEVFNRFDGLVLQFSAMEGLLYTSIHCCYNPGYLDESPYLWKTMLDTTIQGGPYLINNPRTDKGNVIVFDNLNQMILLDENGTIQWKVMLSGPVLSQVYQVDVNRNRQSHLLFNTADNLYMFDLSGESAGNFPVPLLPKATNGLMVLDYDRDKDYRLIMACADRKIYNFDIQGNPVKGWKTPETDSQIRLPLQHLVVAGKDYLIFTQVDGQVLMTDRKGYTRLQIEKSFINSTRSDFFLNRISSASTMLTTDIYGNVIFITPSGKIRKDNFGDFLPDHYFISADFDNDNKEDFIFLDRDQLTIFNRVKEKIFEYSFEDKIDHKPILFNLPAKGTYLGFYSSSSGNVYLFSWDGLVIWTEGIKSDRPFQVGHLENKETFQMVTGYKNEVMTFLFE